MDLSLFVSSDTNNDKDEKVEKFVQKYNYNNTEITNSILTKLLNKYNISNPIKNINIFKQAFVHISYCYNEENTHNLSESSMAFYNKQINKLEQLKLIHKPFINKLSKINKKIDIYTTLLDNTSNIDTDNSINTIILNSVRIAYTAALYAMNVSIVCNISQKRLVLLKTQNNKNMEWLGDSVINMVVSLYLIKRFPNENEGFLTKLRSSIINCDSLSFITQQLGLDKFLIISDYVESINGRTNPKLLQSIFKSLCYCIDKEFSINDRNNFIISILESGIIDISDKILNDTNYKDILLRYYQYQKLSPPSFDLGMIEGESNNRIFTIHIKDNNNKIIGTGINTTKLKAEQDASKSILKNIGLLDNNSILWNNKKKIYDLNQQINNIPLLNFKYNHNNKSITNKFINKLLQKFNINKPISNLELYQIALTHKSYCSNYTDKYEITYAKKTSIDMDVITTQLNNNTLVHLGVKSYEISEFFGDSVLKKIHSDYLNKRFPNNTSGFLTSLRSKTTDCLTLYEIGKKLNLNNYILLSNYEEQNNGRNNKSNIEDITEAFIHALYIDLGEKITEKFIINIYENLVDLTDKIENHKNYKDILLKFYQQKKWGCPIYKKTQTTKTRNYSGKYINIYTFSVFDSTKINIVGIGRASSSQESQQLAAKNTLIHFNQFV